MGTGKGKGKRPKVAQAVGDKTEAQRLAQSLAEPLSTALSGDVVGLEQSATDMTGVAADMGLNEERPAGKQGPTWLSGQLELGYLMKAGLRRAPAVGAATKVTGQVLDDFRSKRDVVDRTRDAAAQVAIGCDDGHLFLSSKFTFLLGKLVAHYEAAVGDQAQPADARAKLVNDFSRINAKLQKQQSAPAAARAETAAQSKELAVRLEEQRDEVAFLTARRQLAAGQAVDEQTLQRAARYAQRMQQQQVAADPAAERRTEPR